MIHTEVLIIGAGLAGERTALEVSKQGRQALLLSLVPPRRSHSTAAQGGLQAALGNSVMSKGDSPDIHFADTVRGADWGCDQSVVRRFVETAPLEVRLAEHWGVPWNRIKSGARTLPNGVEIVEPAESDGLIDARNFGGTSKWRACHAADGTGHALLYAVDSQVVKYNIPVRDRIEALALIHDGQRCYGAVARCLRTGRLEIFTARATVIATGGCGRIYRHTTNAVINTGGGMALALDTGAVPLANMEAVQFHPTGLSPSGILITEGARGDGGVLLDRHGDRFMSHYEPERKDLAPRDVVARCMQSHLDAGHGVASENGPHLWLDIRGLGEKHISAHLKEIRAICLTFNGLDPVSELIPVRPGQHYTMGGIRTDPNCRARGLEGLYAVGEAACWDLHGFNRLGGNSLAETLVAGRIAGQQIALDLEPPHRRPPQSLIEDTLSAQHRRIESISDRGRGKNVHQLTDKLKEILTRDVGIFRRASGLQRAVESLEELYAHSLCLAPRTSCAGSSPELTEILRLPGMVKLGLCVAHGALARTESRGSHFREDYPSRDDAEWLKRTLAYWPKKEDAGRPVLDYEPVDVSEMAPTERGYGSGMPVYHTARSYGRMKG